MSRKPKNNGQPEPNPTNTVLFSQDVVRSAEQKLREAQLLVQACMDRLDRAKESHREQIARSLTSRIPEEKQMATNIANFWEVPIPNDA